MNQINESSIDKWFRQFQLNHGDSNMVMNAKTISDLACLLHDDIPLGYEASMRLGSWMLDIAKTIENLPTQKSCPFCGKGATIKPAAQKDDGTWIPASCGCKDCSVFMHGDMSYGHGGFATENDYSTSLRQAITRWNKRS